MLRYSIMLLCFVISFNGLCAEYIPPQFWPLAGQLVEEVVIEESTLENGSRFTLHRIEDDVVYATFGREGFQNVRLDQTNIAELAKGIESGVVKKNAPNLAERLYKTLFRLDAQGRIIPLELKELKDYKFVLFYFAHGKGSSHADTVGALAENYMRWRELRPELEVIMIQCDAVVFQIPNRTDIQWPFMAASQSLAYLEALHLGQNPHVDSFVITGINGNIVHRYDLSVDTIPSIVESIESILSNQVLKIHRLFIGFEGS